MTSPPVGLHSTNGETIYVCFQPIKNPLLELNNYLRSYTPLKTPIKAYINCNVEHYSNYYE